MTIKKSRSIFPHIAGISVEGQNSIRFCLLVRYFRKYARDARCRSKLSPVNEL
ncbi:MAG: hypothetical protein PVF73_07665 [Bacteroidales bacterium]